MKQFLKVVTARSINNLICLDIFSALSHLFKCSLHKGVKSISNIKIIQIEKVIFFALQIGNENDWIFIVSWPPNRVLKVLPKVYSVSEPMMFAFAGEERLPFD